MISVHEKMKRLLRIFFLLFLIVIAFGFVLPQNFNMPVSGATKSSYNQKSFWYYPWGKSGTHKGVDIFAKEGTTVFPSTNGLVIYSGQIERGGNVVLVLGSKWRLHYYAHLRDIKATPFSFVNSTDTIGTVGTTGNAQGKEPHLHYSIITLIPYVWKIDFDNQGWKKMFYLNPISFLNALNEKNN